MTAHVLLSGQFDNVGDTMHRRVLLDWLRPMGSISAYVGAAPPSFLTGLHLGEADKTESSMRSWLRDALADRSFDRIVAFNPGEFTMGWSRAKGEMALLPLTRVRHRPRGCVLRIGVAAGNEWEFDGRIPEVIIRRAISRNSIVTWREQRSADLFGHGSVFPDLAFALGDAKSVEGYDAQRSVLSVTMRSDRPRPAEAFLSAVRATAQERDLQIVVTSQVRRDNARSAELATSLEGEYDPWTVEQSHEEREEHVRALYRRSFAIVSDRLHALIAASTEGALPLGLQTHPGGKVQAHFDPLDLKVGLDVSRYCESEILDHIKMVFQSRTAIRSGVLKAQREIQDFGARLPSMII